MPTAGIDGIYKGYKKKSKKRAVQVKYLHPYSPFCYSFDCLSPLENGSERQGGSSPEYLYFSIVIAIGSTNTTSFYSDVAYAVYVYV